jgi:hypothetical protein
MANNNNNRSMAIVHRGENPNLYRQLVCIMTASEVDRLANAISTGDDD